MKTIPLTKNQVAIVDDADYEWLSQYKWQAHGRDGKLYAARHEPKTHKTLLMHREILGVTGVKCDVDHANHKTLDNRRGNIRACTRTENLLNRSAPKHNKSGFKGVNIFVNKKGNWQKVYWVAQFCRKCLGYFDAAWKAALAYNEAAIAQHAEFAMPNDLSGVFDGT